MVVALLVQTAYFVLLYLALDLADSAASVALVVSLQPILVALLAPRLRATTLGCCAGPAWCLAWRARRW